MGDFDFLDRLTGAQIAEVLIASGVSGSDVSTILNQCHGHADMFLHVLKAGLTGGTIKYQTKPCPAMVQNAAPPPQSPTNVQQAVGTFQRLEDSEWVESNSGAVTEDEHTTLEAKFEMLAQMYKELEEDNEKLRTEMMWIIVGYKEAQRAYAAQSARITDLENRILRMVNKDDPFKQQIRRVDDRPVNWGIGRAQTQPLDSKMEENTP